MSIESAVPVNRRYDPSGLIAHGGAADVYRATDTTLDREVAVKLLRDATSSAADRQRFVDEGRILAQLDHPGLVTLFDVGADDDRPFIVMELVEGESLAERLAAGPLDLEEVSELGEQLAAALAYAHDAGVVHRDVKPGNILLGNDGRYRLTDFGIARLVDDASRQTGAGLTVGTAAYLAPEQARGEAVEQPADVYSLGLVLIEAITGQRVYTGTPMEAAVARLERPPDVPLDVPRAWQGLLREMTATTPADRPTAAAVTDRLRTMRTAPAIEPGPQPAPAPAPAPAMFRPRSLPVLRVALLAAVLALLVGSALLVRGDPTPRASGSAAPQVASALQTALEDLHAALSRLPGSHPAAAALAAVDRALQDLRYPAGRRALNRLIRVVNADLANGVLDQTDGSRVVAAATSLLALLPPATDPAEPSTAPSPQADAGQSSATEDTPGKASGKKKSPGKGKGKAKGKRG